MDFSFLNIDLEGLTARKVSDKYIRKTFDVPALSKQLSETSFETVKEVPVRDIFMGQPMKVETYANSIKKLVGAKEGQYIQTVRTQQGHFFRILNEKKVEVTESDVVRELKEYIKTLLKESNVN